MFSIGNDLTKFMQITFGKKYKYGLPFSKDMHLARFSVGTSDFEFLYENDEITFLEFYNQKAHYVMKCSGDDLLHAANIILNLGVIDWKDCKQFDKRREKIIHLACKGKNVQYKNEALQLIEQNRDLALIECSDFHIIFAHRFMQEHDERVEFEIIDFSIGNNAQSFTISFNTFVYLYDYVRLMKA